MIRPERGLRRARSVSDWRRLQKTSRARQEAVGRLFPRSLTVAARLDSDALSFDGANHLDEFDAACHLVRLQDFPDEFQGANDLTDGAVLLVAIYDAWVSDALVMQSEEIVVICEDNASFGQCEGNVVGVIRAEQTRVGGCGHADTATAQAVGNGSVDVFIKMEPDRPGHSSLPAFP